MVVSVSYEIIQFVSQRMLCRVLILLVGEMKYFSGRASTSITFSPTTSHVYEDTFSCAQTSRTKHGVRRQFFTADFPCPLRYDVNASHCVDDYSTISMVDRRLAKKCRDELLWSRTADGSSCSLASGSDWLDNNGKLNDDTAMAKIVDHISRHWNVLDEYTLVVEKTDAVATGRGSTQHTYAVSVSLFRPDRGNLTCGSGDGSRRVGGLGTYAPSGQKTHVGRKTSGIAFRSICP